MHSAELNALLLRMRGAPIEGKHVLVMTKPQAEWVLAEMTGDPPRPRPISERVFTNLAEAEWHVFKLRWEVMYQILCQGEEGGTPWCVSSTPNRSTPRCHGP